jgi:NTE family protein
MSKNLAFVLSGGGARGALQVGALYALLESGLHPDILIGTSIGAVNAAFVALRGFSKQGLDELSESWHKASQMDLLPSNYIWMAVRAMFGRSVSDPATRIRDFMIQNGVTPELRFSDLNNPRLYIVSADLNSGQPVIHGDSPEDKVLEGLLLSTALPPWIKPVRKQERYLMDGGVVSNLPVEPAIQVGAQQIVALDLMDTRETFGGNNDVVTFLDRLSMAVEKRQNDLEMALAEARGIPIIYAGLTGDAPVPYWDFQQTEALASRGYEIMQKALEENKERARLFRGHRSPWFWQREP